MIADIVRTIHFNCIFYTDVKTDRGFIVKYLQVSEDIISGSAVCSNP